MKSILSNGGSVEAPRREGAPGPEAGAGAAKALAPADRERILLVARPPRGKGLVVELRFPLTAST